MGLYRPCPAMNFYRTGMSRYVSMEAAAAAAAAAAQPINLAQGDTADDAIEL
jgi:hypothetical protein